MANKFLDFFKQKKEVEAKEKDAVLSGNFEILRRILSPELTKTGMLQQYHRSLYVYACISKIAEKVASIDLDLYQIINSKGDIKEIDSHPILDLMYHFNPFQTKQEFLETTVINMKLAGEAFWYKVRNNKGQVAELWNLRPDYMEVIKDDVNFIFGYKFHKADGTFTTFLPEEIVHIKYPDPLSAYTGLSPMKAAQVTVQTQEYAQQFQRDFFLNSARPDAVIKTTQSNVKREKKEEIRSSFNLRHQGPGNSSKIAILDGGYEYQQIALNQKEMDYIESLKFTRDDILVAFKVPKPILSIVEDVNRANSETAMTIFLSETIVPEVKRILAKVNEELIAPDFGDQYFLDFDDPTPDNRDIIIKEYANGLQNNWLLINEVRAKENLPPVKGGWSFYMPLVNQPVGGLTSEDLNTAKAINTKDIDEKLEAENERKFKEAQKPRRFNFKGHFLLQQKFLMFEQVKEAAIAELQKQKKTKKVKGKKGKKAARSIIESKDVKKAYANLQIKKMDKTSGQLKEAVNKFAIEQHDRVLANLKNEVKGKRKKKFLITSIFNAEKEAKIAVDFIIPYLETYLKESGKEALNMIAPQQTFQDSKRIEDVIKKRAKEFAESVNNTTLEKLDGTLAEGIAAGEGIAKLADRVESVYADFPAYRSELIARTEATAANNEGLLEGFNQSEVANGKEWIATEDGRIDDICAGLDGEIVGLDEQFSSGDDIPPDHPNCRCVIGPAFIE